MCAKDREVKGYGSTVISMFKTASFFALTILGPTNSREDQFGCFEIWDGLFDTQSARILAITWISCIGASIINVKCLKKNNSENKTVWDCLKLILDVGIVLTVLCSFLVLFGIALISNITGKISVATAIAFGVDFPKFSNVLAAIGTDNVAMSLPVTFYLGFQFCRLTALITLGLQVLLKAGTCCCTSSSSKEVHDTYNEPLVTADHIGDSMVDDAGATFVAERNSTL
jgi:hypothetical protein